MLKTRMKRLAAVNHSAVKRLAGIEHAMTVRSDEDIFDPPTSPTIGHSFRSAMTGRSPVGELSSER